MKPKDECQIADSLGSILSRSRAEARWTVAEVSRNLGIPEKWIAKAEADQWLEMADDAYSRTYFRTYCRQLGLDVSTMANIYRQVRQRSRLTARKAADRHQHPSVAVPTRQLIVTPQAIRRGAAGLLGLCLIGYFWWAVAHIVTPPKIAVMSPTDGLVVEDRRIVIEGVTEAEVALRINGKEVAPDSSGYFRDTIDLADGLNTIQITGAKKHSKETTVIRRIIVQPPAPPAAMLGPAEPAGDGQPITNQTSP